MGTFSSYSSRSPSSSSSSSSSRPDFSDVSSGGSSSAPSGSYGRSAPREYTGDSGGSSRPIVTIPYHTNTFSMGPASSGLSGRDWIASQGDSRNTLLGEPSYRGSYSSSGPRISGESSVRDRYSNIFRSNSGGSGDSGAPAPRSKTKAWSYDFPKQERFSDYTGPQQARISRDSLKGPSDPPVSEGRLRALSESRYKPYTAEQNKEAMQPIYRLTNSNAMKGNYGIAEQGKRFARNAFRELPVIGELTRGFSQDKTGFTGNTRTGRVARTLSGIATTGMPIGPAINFVAGGLGDAASDLISPPKPYYPGGPVGTESSTRMKFDPTTRTFRPASYWEGD